MKDLGLICIQNSLGLNLPQKVKKTIVVEHKGLHLIAGTYVVQTLNPEIGR